MRTSELQRAVDEEFGGMGAVLLADQVLPGLDGRTGAEALADGVPPRAVWLALCEAQEVPQARRHGAGRRAPLR
ncbi:MULTISPECIES: DUF3046 domain-containing protein [unclassified Agrococcus]|uniref:DUF3046 domain-containing protein n=1 Tax=unclassified Agrococcus TaxID=2615065 RepID=UPI003609C577